MFLRQRVQPTPRNEMLEDLRRQEQGDGCKGERGPRAEAPTGQLERAGGGFRCDGSQNPGEPVGERPGTPGTHLLSETIFSGGSSFALPISISLSWRSPASSG